MQDELVWYAAYGSNVDQARFLTYLAGGPVPGADDVQAGAADPTPPRREEPHRFGRGIRFAHHSRRWKGAVAVLDHDANSIGALGRRYLITAAQFADVMAQENRRPTVDLPVAELNVNEIRPIGEAAYDGLLLLAFDEGTPVVTFTSPRQPRDLGLAPPSPPYLGTIARGVHEAHDMSPAEVARHLHHAPGVAPTWTVEDIEALIE
jgi:hypothetical protein